MWQKIAEGLKVRLLTSNVHNYLQKMLFLFLFYYQSIILFALTLLKADKIFLWQSLLLMYLLLTFGQSCLS